VSLLLRPRAVRDLEQIWDYTVERWGAPQAERYVRAIRDTCTALANGEATGIDASDVAPTYRRLRAGRHVLFLRLQPNGDIDVVRILHERMDARSHLAP
jgi:toxin ParE1/3/4